MTKGGNKQKILKINKSLPLKTIFNRMINGTRKFLKYIKRETDRVINLNINIVIGVKKQHIIETQTENC